MCLAASVRDARSPEAIHGPRLDARSLLLNIDRLARAPSRAKICIGGRHGFGPLILLPKPPIPNTDILVGSENAHPGDGNPLVYTWQHLNKV